jgi:hypothetical protein
MKMKKIPALIALLTLTIGLTVPAGAVDLPDEQWFLPTPYTTGGQELQSITIQENLQIAANTSSLSSVVRNALGQDRYCKTISDEFCGTAAEMRFDAILPRCATDAETNCVVSISAISPAGEEKTGTYVRNFPDAGFTDFPAAPERNLPQGSTPSLWKIPGLINGGGTDEYLINFTLRGNVFNTRDKFNFNGYSAFISPVTVKQGGYGRFQKRDGRGKDQVECVRLALACGSEMLGRSADETKICASIEEGACALKQSFPSGYRFKFKVRLSTSPTGWVHGRLKAPVVDISKTNSGIDLTVEGDPVVVPAIGATQPYASLPENIRDLYKGHYGGGSYGDQGPTGRRNQISQPAPDQETTFAEYALWKDYIKDKANASPSNWTVRTLEVTRDTAECFNDTSKFIGVVTTNAMMYSGGPPVFNKSAGTLEYKVGSPHLTSKGEVFKGSYDLQVNSEVARCLYKFTSAPIQANISIVNETGESSIATTVVNEKDGWLRLAAYGFTFSTPTVKITLTQAAAVPTPSATPTPTASAKPVAAKKTSITCVKGKTTKKVTAVNPKCPSGYKKK